jgi:hypothetical protein
MKYGSMISNRRQIESHWIVTIQLLLGRSLKLHLQQGKIMDNVFFWDTEGVIVNVARGQTINLLKPSGNFTYHQV